jgi:L-asparaginase II
MAAAPAPLVRVVRSGLEESIHLGDVAVCDPAGRLVASAGDPRRRLFIRSSAKPLQAAVSIDAMGIDEGLPDRLVAIMCGSHGGEPVHTRAVRDVLRRGGLAVGDLRTPPAWPSDPSSARRLTRPAPLYHNCSGKHAGMLLASTRRGWPLATYPKRSHPLQRRVLGAVRLLTGEEAVDVGVDGCGVPVHGVTLRGVATMYARLSEPDRGDGLAPAIVRATSSMRAHPYLVGGRDAQDTAIMRSTDDLVVKYGAEALDAAVSLGAGLGIAVKVADGSYRAVAPTLISVLDQLGLLSAGARRALRSRASPPVRGGGRPVGRLEPVVRLRGKG